MGTQTSNNLVGQSFDSTHLTTSTQFYRPFQSFYPSLAGCPLNGPWTINIYSTYGEHNHNGYLFDWEIVFNESLASDVGTIDSAAVLVPNSGGQASPFFTRDGSDTTFVFHAPVVAQDTDIEDTLRVFDPIAECWYDTVIHVVVSAVGGGFSYDSLSVCAGESVTLTAQCARTEGRLSQDFDAIGTGGDTWHSLSHNEDGHTYYGPGSQEVDAISTYVSALSDFPIRSKVFPAGGKVKLGNGDETGSMTSVPMNLSGPFSVQVRAKGWGSEPASSTAPKKTRVNVVVDKGQPMEQIRYFDTDPTYRWPGTDAYRSHSLLFDGATVASTITLETVPNGNQYDTRAFIDYVGTRGEGCTYVWSTGDTAQSIQVSPDTTTTYAVTVTPAGGCARVDTVVVRVKGVTTGDTNAIACDSFT